MYNETLATEIIKELRASCRRWFVIAIVTMCLWFATVVGFIVYEYYSLPSDTVTVENEDGNANYIGNDMLGDFNYGKDNENEER